LRSRLQEVLTHKNVSGDPSEVCSRLARVALAELRGDESREDAITLLTADALITYACEATAEQGPEGLAEIR
jgi:hypothetical protein